MGKLCRLLSVILLSLCFLNPRANAEDCAWWRVDCHIGNAIDYTAQVVTTGCWDDCDALSSEQAKETAKRIISGAGDDDALVKEYNESLKESHCKECSNNVAKASSYFGNENVCKPLCTEMGKSESACTKICKDLKEKGMTDVSASNSCFSSSFDDSSTFWERTVDESTRNAIKKEAIEFGVYTGSTAGGGAIGATIGAIVGSIIPGAGTVAGAAIGAVIGELAGAIGFGVWHWLTGGVVANPTGSAVAAKYSEILADFMGEDGSGCWFCPIFETIFTTINTLATDLYINLRGLMLSLLAICAMAWLLWTIFRFITTIHGPNIGELMTTLFKGLGTVMIISIILWAHPSFITRYIVDPIAAFGSGLSRELLQIQSGGATDTMVYQQYANNNSVCERQNTAYSRTVEKKICEPPENALFEGRALSADVYYNMDCLLRSISLTLISGIALGSTLMSVGVTGGALGFLPQFDVLTVGLVIMISYFILYIFIPFKLIDLVLRLGFSIILLPLFITCMATPATRKYAKTGWDMFLSCWITLIALSLFIAFSITLISSVLTS